MARRKARRTGRRVVGYIRVSKAKQAEKGVSLETQREKIEGYCKLNDLELVGVKVEVKTGTVMRDVLQECLDMIEGEEVDGLVVWNLDRFARSVKDNSTMVERYFTDDGMGARLISVTEQLDTYTAGGRLVVNILAAVHQHEAERLRERIRDNLDRLAEDGFWIGGTVPYGWRAKPREFTEDGKRLPRKLEPDPTELEVIAKARELQDKGLSMGKIGLELGRLRYRSRTGGAFSAQQVSNMLDSTRRYATKAAAN